MQFIKNLFSKPAPPTTDHTLQEITALKDIIEAHFKKIETKQKETTIQLDTINETLLDGDMIFIDAIIKTLEAIEDLYQFSATRETSGYTTPINTMWQKALTAVAPTGLEVISTTGGSFDAHIHSIVATQKDPYKSNGEVLKILKAGYKYKSQVLQTAAVEVNKL